MNIMIKVKNLPRDAYLENLIYKRMSSITKIMDTFKEGVNFIIEVEKETNRHTKGDIFKAEVLVSLPGKRVIAKAHGENLESVMSDIKDEVYQEIKKYKGKKIDVPRRKNRKIKNEII